MKTRQPLLPDDLDDRFFQCAPPDQQAPQFLRGGEPVVLLRLTPAADLRFTLPKVYLGFETRFYDGNREIHTATQAAHRDPGARLPARVARVAHARCRATSRCTSSSARSSR